MPPYKILLSIWLFLRKKGFTLIPICGSSNVSFGTSLKEPNKLIYSEKKILLWRKKYKTTGTIRGNREFKQTLQPSLRERCSIELKFSFKTKGMDNLKSRKGFQHCPTSVCCRKRFHGFTAKMAHSTWIVFR